MRNSYRCVTSTRILRSAALLLVILAFLFPGRVLAERPEIGTVIDHTNWQKYKEYLGTAVQTLMEKNYISYRIVDRHKHMTFPIDPWTEKCNGQASVGPNDELINYCGAGVPFPQIDLNDPKAGAKAYWNQDKRYTGDTAIMSPATVMIIDKKGHERSFTAEMLYFKATERTVLPPIPAIPNSDTRAYIRINTLAPFDMKGFAVVMDIKRYELNLPDQQWAYIPMLRRVRRMSTALKGDSFAGTDLTYSDSYPGAPYEFTSKILDFKEMLMCAYCDDACMRDLVEKRQGLKIYNIPVEFTQIYVVEVTPKDKNYHYSKYVYYLDSEYWGIQMKECYDLKGELWKLQTFYGVLGCGAVGAAGVTSMTDLQADHMTFNDSSKSYKYNADLPEKEFLPQRLKELGQ
jgi:hypothetical protein